MATKRSLQKVRKYTKDKIIMTVKDLERKGIDLSHINLRKEGFEGMINAAKREFGEPAWYRVLKKIRIKRDYRRHVRKDIKSVLNEVKKLYKKEKDLRPVIMREKHSVLWAWIEHNCKYWDLLDKCGIDPNRVYFSKKPQGYWSRGKILEILGKIPEDELSQVVIRTKYPNLYSAMRKGRLFKKGFGEAINELGKQKGIANYYERIRGDKNTAAKYGMAFQNLTEKVFNVLGKKYSPQIVFRYKNETIIPDFVDIRNGTWIDAKVNPYSPEVEKTICKALRRNKRLIVIYLKRKRRSTNKQIIFRNISYYYSALLKSGDGGLVNKLKRLEKEKLPRKTLDDWAVVWPKKKIEKGFRKLLKQKERINSKHIQDNHPRLFHAIVRKYKSYESFIKKLGLDYNYIKEEAKARQRENMMKYSKDYFLKKGVAYYKKGTKLNPTNILDIDPTFYWSATDKNHFACWKNYIFELKEYLLRLGYKNFELLRNRNRWSRQI